MRRTTGTACNPDVYQIKHSYFNFNGLGMLQEWMLQGHYRSYQKANQEGGGEKKGRPKVEMGLRNVGVKRWGKEVWTEKDGYLSWGKPWRNLKSCSAKGGGGGGKEEIK